MSEENEKNTMGTLLYSGSQTTESGCEYILPDYLPDVRKILRVSPIPQISGKYMNGEKAELEGTVISTVFYLSEEGTVHSFKVTGAFEESIQIRGLNENCVITAQVHPESSSFRLSGPRKLTLHSKLKTQILAVSGDSAAPDIGFGKQHPVRSPLCIDYGTVKTCRIASFDADELHYAEDITADGKTVTEILSCDISDRITETHASGGAIVCRGEYTVTLFVCFSLEEGAKADYGVLEKRVPFTETLEAPGITDDTICIPDLTVTGCESALSGEGKLCAVDFSAMLSVLCFTKAECRIIKDAYIPGFETKCTVRETPVFRPLFTESGTVTVSGEGKIDHDEQITALLYENASVNSAEPVFSDGKMILSGSVTYSAIAVSGNEQYFPVSFSAPFRWEMNAGISQTEVPCVQISLNSKTVSGHYDHKTHIVSADIQILVSAFIGCAENERIITEISVSEETEDSTTPKYPIILYYPYPGESVWDIAKKYHVTPESLRVFNHFPAEKKTTDTSDAVLFIPTETQSF